MLGGPRKAVDSGRESLDSLSGRGLSSEPSTEYHCTVILSRHVMFSTPISLVEEETLVI